MGAPQTRSSHLGGGGLGGGLGGGAGGELGAGGLGDGGGGVRPSLGGSTSSPVVTALKVSSAAPAALKKAPESLVRAPSSFTLVSVPPSGTSRMQCS